MGETEDPYAALGEKAVSRRAAATRDLARTGTVDDALALIGVATTDKSTSIRLVAASAAAEILMRHRGAAGQTRLTAEERAEVVRRVGAGDPAANPTLMLCYAAIPETAVIQRLTRALRDPRNGVRAGAVAAIRRMALSAAATEEATGLREWVGEALANRKLPADAAVELVRLVGDVGWPELSAAVKALAGGPGGLAEAVPVALERLAARADPASWAGVWVDEGLDVLQEGTTGDPAWRVIDPDTAASVSDGRLALPDGSARRIWAPRPREEGVHPALQVAGRTWWRKEGAALVQLVETLDGRLAELTDLAGVVADGLRGLEGAAAMRARVILAVRTGAFADALEELAPAMSGKKPRNDLYFLHGLAAIGAGRASEGHASLRVYLERAKKKEPWRDEAERLLP